MWPFIKAAVSGRSDNGVKAAVFKTENAVAVGVFAALDAAAAKNALAGIADYGGVEHIHGGGSFFALEHILFRAGELCHVKQLAATVFIALLALHGVVGKQKLNAGAAGNGCLGRSDVDFHSVGNGVYAGGHKASCAFYLNKADAAGTAAAFAVVKIAKRGNFISAALCGFKNCNALFHKIRVSFDFNAYHFHVVPSLFLKDCAELAGRHAHSAADANLGVNGEGNLAHLAGNCVHRALFGTKAALAAFIRVDIVIHKVFANLGTAFFVVDMLHILMIEV